MVGEIKHPADCGFDLNIFLVAGAAQLQGPFL
jgi:hypothetical protein